MQTITKNLSDTKVQLTMQADQALLDDAKHQVLRSLAKTMKLPGFRPGKAPLPVVEKHADQGVLQSEFLDRAMNQMYAAALDSEKLRPVSPPQAKVTKFVPFTDLAVEIEVDVIGKVTLGDYKKFKMEKPAVKVTDKDVETVLTQLQTRDAERKEVKRAAKKDDQVVVDFAGVDAQTKEPIQGADGKGYPLVLGSDSFIPGFEANLIGMKAGEDKTFTLEFPNDYAVGALQGRKVTFTVTAQKVEEIVTTELSDEFASKVGPFKTVDELKADIRKQLEAEKQNRADRELENRLLEELTEKSKVAIPQNLVEQEADRMEQDERQNLLYRGQTWEEHLKQEGVTEKEHRDRMLPDAEKRVKSGLVLAEVAEVEKIDVTAEELNLRLQLLKGQYQDKAMQAELDKPENRREIASRMLTEKAITVLVGYATAKKA